MPVFLTKPIATFAVPDGRSPDRGPYPSLDLCMSPYYNCFAIFNLIFVHVVIQCVS